jgi:hypothetical protein
VVIVRVTPSLPRRGRLPKGSPPWSPSCAGFSINLLARRGSDKAPGRLPKGGNTRKIQMTSFVNRCFNKF